MLDLIIRRKVGHPFQFGGIVEGEQVDPASGVIVQDLRELEVMAKAVAPIADPFGAIPIVPEAGQIVLHAVQGGAHGGPPLRRIGRGRNRRENGAARAHGIPIAGSVDPLVVVRGVLQVGQNDAATHCGGHLLAQIIRQFAPQQHLRQRQDRAEFPGAQIDPNLVAIKHRIPIVVVRMQP